MQELSVLLLAIPVLAIAVCAVAFWIWMLVDCIKHESSEGNDKIVWVIVILATKLIGAIVYYFARRPKRMRLASGR
ncbi:MAG: PLD nuclease N-terminal domain-containing protein [Myxococcota bacterium]